MSWVTIGVMHTTYPDSKLAEQTPQTPEGFPSPLPQPLPYAIGLPRGEGSKSNQPKKSDSAMSNQNQISDPEIWQNNDIGNITTSGKTDVGLSPHNQIS